MMKRFGTCILLISLALLGLLCPQVPAQKPAALPELTFKRLLNDLQIIVASTPNLGESMTIGLVLRYGSAFDPSEKGGLANLLARMFAKATLDKSAKDIQDELNYIQANLEVRCTWDGMYFLLRGQSSEFERSLLLLYQVVGEAQFNDEDFAKAKSEVLQEIDKSEDPRQHIRMKLETLLFRGTTYARNLHGSRLSVQNITLGDVRYFYRRCFSSGSAALVFAGSAPVPDVIQKATRIWGVWVKKDDIPYTFLPPREPASRNIFLEDDPTTPAAQFVLGNLWPRRDDPSYYPGVLAARILQERLTKALPTSLLTAGFEGRRMPGIFYIQGQAAAEQAVDEIKKILDLVDKVKASAASPQELAEIQKRWILEFNDSFTSTDGICRNIMESELYRLGTNYAASFQDLVRRCSPDMVKEAAIESLMPGGVFILVRGPAATLKAGLESLGVVQTVSP